MLEKNERRKPNWKLEGKPSEMAEARGREGEGQRVGEARELETRLRRGLASCPLALSDSSSYLQLHTRLHLTTLHPLPTLLQAMAPPSTTQKVDAFAMMRQAAAGKKASTTDSTPTASGSGSASKSTGAGGAGMAAMFKPKGSGLGAGPKHVVDHENQPWVEK